MPRSTPKNAPDAGTGEIFGLHLAVTRRARGLTLDQLAQATGLNKGYLSRLERREKRPSIATVMKVAQALDVPVAALFGESFDETAMHLVRKDETAGGFAADGEASFTLLSRATRASGAQAFLYVPGPEFRPRGHVHHAGTEMIFVVRGALEIRFHDRTLTLEEGDFLQFPGHVPHQLRRLREATQALITVAE
ncbi:MAG: XRE family transcriptional regulator [Proteobacteria bacterium]|nr:XRE family transcriptional regulator [Pseudomonadota bacterium]